MSFKSKRSNLLVQLSNSRTKHDIVDRQSDAPITSSFAQF